jgi:HPt (histidine-containing phosphotransfer) domain-containing protein
MNEDEKPFEGLEPFVEKFLLDRINELEVIKQSLLNKDYTSLQKLMHQWKGFCEPYGFGPLAKLSIKLEEQAKRQSHSECEKFAEEIKKYLLDRQQRSK